MYSIAFSSEFQDAYKRIGNLRLKDYEDYVRNGPGSSKSLVWTDPIQKAFSTVVSFYGLLGQLLKRNLIDMELVTDWIAGSEPLTLHERVKTIIGGIRIDVENPTRNILFEYLIDEFERGAKESLSKRREQKLQQRGVESG